MDAKQSEVKPGTAPFPSAAPLRKLNLNLLYPLDAILRARNLTEAGREVRLSQSAMSHALRRLREHFGDDLVIHVGGEQQLTPLGLALRPEVQRVMREVDGALNFSLAFDPMTSSGTLTVAASEAVEQMLLGPVLGNLSTAAPGLNISICPLDVARPERALDDGADLLLLPGERTLERLESLPILNDQASCMIWAKHPMLQDCDDLTEAQYRAARHIVARGELTESFPLDAAGAEMLRARHICIRASSQATLPAIIIGSDLVATGSMWLFQHYASMMPLKVVTAPFARRPNQIVAQWPRHRRDPMLAWFVDQIRERRQQYPGALQ
ncbi:LysR family transcriptional regulator [Sphingomonas kyeonggiensis]|uniref:DNA-binding transcriptional LysR family regulator n=1 Tax=Sphingomonas kyeonggiensis TaxID=1268553 RepID=A0A7W6NX76_9SPHN|nr:LysR family transcriptional regulator [Sphingomonas kyeonggiensis]MBB4099322.1 DNA-binding transcriptional LysR family regulator [Sphingomonas kyeonggiensis]